MPHVQVQRDAEGAGVPPGPVWQPDAPPGEEQQPDEFQHGRASVSRRLVRRPLYPQPSGGPAQGSENLQYQCRGGKSMVT